MYLLRSLLDKINESYAQTFHPLDVAQVKRLSIVMKKAGFEVVPMDYVNFLTWTDGLVWNDLELFSVYPHDRADTIYAQPTLLDMQKKHCLQDTFPHKLILGSALEELICYNADSKKYEILDRFTYESILQFPRFVDVLYFYAHAKGSVTSPTETGS